jgi:Tol biopolymer transport system component
MEDIISHIVEYNLKKKKSKIIASFTNSITFLNLIKPSSYYFCSSQRSFHCKNSEIIELKEERLLNKGVRKLLKNIYVKDYVSENITENINYIAMIHQDQIFYKTIFFNDVFCSIRETILFVGYDKVKADWDLFYNDGYKNKKFKNSQGTKYAEYFNNSNKLLLAIEKNMDSQIYIYDKGKLQQLTFNKKIYCMYPHISHDNKFLYFTSIDPQLIENDILPKSCECEIFLMNLETKEITSVVKYHGSPLVNKTNNWYNDKFYFVIEEILHSDFACNNLQCNI